MTKNKGMAAAFSGDEIEIDLYLSVGSKLVSCYCKELRLKTEGINKRQ